MISIIIPHLKGSNILMECLSSIIKHTQNVRYEIIIVDNNSTDGSVNAIKQKFSDIKIIQSNINRGYAGGCNLGAENAKGEYLLFLNNDTKITNGAIELLVDAMKIDENISSVQPKIKNYYNKNLFDYAGACGGYIDYLGYPFSRGRIFNTIEEDLGQYDSKKKIFWASGTAFITRKDIFIKMNGFDEILFAHMEEIDYHWKCLLNGYDVYIEPKSVVYHKGGQTLPYDSYKKIYLNHRNSMILFLTNHQNLSFKLILKRFALNDIAALYYLCTGNFKGFGAVCMANLWMFFNIRYLLKRRMKIKKIIPSNSNIDDDLMLPYSIVKKYFYSNKKTYNKL